MDLVSAADNAPLTVIEAVLEHAAAHAVPVISTIYTGNGVAAADPLCPIAHLDTIPRVCANPWEEDAVRARISAAGRHRVVILGNCAEGGVSFAALGALELGYQPYVVVDAMQSASVFDASTALTRMTQAGVIAVTGRQLLLEWGRQSHLASIYGAAWAPVRPNGRPPGCREPSLPSPVSAIRLPSLAYL